MHEEKMRFRNHYRHCGTEWEDVWSCMCNDRCPVCGAEIEPYRSEDLGAGDEGGLFAGIQVELTRVQATGEVQYLVRRGEKSWTVRKLLSGWQAIRLHGIHCGMVEPGIREASAGEAVGKLIAVLTAKEVA